MPLPRIDPATVCRDQRVRFLPPPAAALVYRRQAMLLQHGINRRPGSLHGVLAGEERCIAGHRVAQKPRIARLLNRLFIDKVKLSLVADKLGDSPSKSRAAKQVRSRGAIGGRSNSGRGPRCLRN